MARNKTETHHLPSQTRYSSLTKEEKADTNFLIPFPRLSQGGVSILMDGAVVFKEVVELSIIKL
jgi:hypothetical protein